VDAVVIALAGVATVVLGRRLVLHGWLAKRVGTDTAALLRAAILPTALVAWSAARQQLHPVLVLIGAALARFQFAGTRWALRSLGDDFRPR
jgi:hypothetical protein